jgi:hypothetical protein
MVGSPFAVVIGDFSRDSRKISLLGRFDRYPTRDGLGGLAPSRCPGRQPFSLAIGDFNGDVKQDLAIANTYGGGLSIGNL